MELVAEDLIVETTALGRAHEFIANVGEYPGTYEGRGIVVCGGGATYFTNAWVCFSLLRHLGCILPIQLWYLGRQEVDPYMEELLAPLGVECVDASALRDAHAARILNGWEVKPYAILHCPFREVMLLDADNFAAVNPEYLFDTPEYRDTGAIFWPDIGRMQRDSPIWNLFGVPYRDEPEFESGQIVIDKARCWKAMCLTKHYNDYSDFYYRYVYGDKDTFHFAFRKVRQPYAMTSHAVRDNGQAFFQHDFAGRVVFQHRNRAKWTLEDENPFIEGFRHEAECFGFLDALKLVWDGSVGSARKSVLPKASARSNGTSVAPTGWLHYGVTRDLCPDVAIVIAPPLSVVPAYIARAMQDNVAGEVLLIDRVEEEGEHPVAEPHGGSWRRTAEGEWRFALFGTGGRIRRMHAGPNEAVVSVREAIGERHAGMLVIEGAHSTEQCLREFELYSSLMTHGVVLVHHSANRDSDVASAMNELRVRGFEVATMNGGRDVSIVPIGRAPPAEHG